MTIMTFKEADMVGADYLICFTMIASVGLRIYIIANEDPLEISVANLQVVLVLNQNKHLTADLSQVRIIGFSVMPSKELFLGVIVSSFCSGDDWLSGKIRPACFEGILHRFTLSEP